MTLRFGDALSLYGPRAKLKVLGAEPDFVCIPLTLVLLDVVLLVVPLFWPF